MVDNFNRSRLIGIADAQVDEIFAFRQRLTLEPCDLAEKIRRDE